MVNHMWQDEPQTGVAKVSNSNTALIKCSEIKFLDSPIVPGPSELHGAKLLSKRKYLKNSPVNINPIHDIPWLKTEKWVEKWATSLIEQ